MVATRVDLLKHNVQRVFEEAFNQGNLDVIDEVVPAGTRDHQNPEVTDFAAHLKAVVTALRTAFPDLRFDTVQLIGEGDWISLYSIMSGTHTGPLTPPVLPKDGPPVLPPTGKAIRVPHLYLMRFAEDGHDGDLYHLMDTFAMLGQLGVMPGGRHGA